MPSTTAKAKANAAYEAVPDHFKEDVIDAAIWARETLTQHEGGGHHFEISAEKDGLLSVSFAKPRWAGDHSGEPMPTAAEAFVMAVCEYLNGC